VPPPPAPKPYCKLCNVSCSNEYSFQQHLNGAAHRKKLSQTQNNQFHCKVCDITCPNEFSLNQHLNGEKHKKRMTATAAPPAEDNTAVDSSPYQFHCSLCNISCINEFSLLQHMSGVRHKKQAAGGTAAVVQCNACNVRCSSEFNLLQHLSGEAHKSRIAELSNSTSSGSSTAGAGAEQQAQEQQWYCDACRVGCPSEESYKQHINGKRHKKKVAKREEEMLKEMVQAAEMKPSAVNSNDNAMVPQIANSSNDATALPVASNPAVKLESKDDSDEEGLIDEEKEDISNLYDDFPGHQPSLAKENNGEQAAAPGMQGNDSDDDNDMFGDDTSNPADGAHPNLKEEGDNLSENDEADMFDFDDSYEETGSGDGKSIAVHQTLDSGLAFALDYSPDTKSTIVQQMDNARTPSGIVILYDGKTPAEAVPPGLNICPEFVVREYTCPLGNACPKGHARTLKEVQAHQRAIWCKHLKNTNAAYINKWKLGGIDTSGPDYDGLIGSINQPPERAGNKPPTELGIIFLRNPNIPNSQVFPPQLKAKQKGELVALCPDFTCVGKMCAQLGSCKLSHAKSYNVISQEGFDALCEHLHSNRIGWLSADLLRKKGCRVCLKPKFQYLMGDANGCAVDYPLDTVQSDSTTNSKNAGISWADNADSQQGTALLEKGATVTAPNVLAAARTHSVLKKPRYSKNIDAKALPNITRPSSLERSYYQQVHPDKFWAELRNWDFLSDLNRAMKSKGSVKKDQDLQKGIKRTLDESNDAKKTKASLPDTFESVTQYKALWAPLLIEEAKAQIMSEVVAAQSSPNTAWIQNAHVTKGSEVKAELSTSARTSSDEGESAPMEPTVIVRLKRGAGIGCQIFPNDLLLFSPTVSAVERALRGIAFDTGNDSSLTKGRFGFIGRALNHRSSSVDGLLVRVSQKLWAQFSSLKELFVIKVGSNITAVREFNALMRVDKLPLNKYLLDGKMATKQDGQQQKGKILDELPMGFQKFLKSKANSSQLDAISAAAREYGEGGFTLIKGPPGTGKSTTLVSTLNALHLRQYQEYYTTIERVTTEEDALEDYELLASLNKAAKVKPRILVCAPSNAAIDNVIVKIMNDRFVDGKGSKYSPSIVRVGAGSTNPQVSGVGLKDVVNRIIEEGSDVNKLEEIISNGRRELGRLQKEIQRLRARIRAIVDASPYPISSDWEIRVDEENFEKTGRVFFVNHRHKTTTFDVPPKNRPIETPANIQRMPHYRKLLDSLTKFVEKHNTDSSNLEKYIILQNIANAKAAGEETHFHQLENHVLNSSHIVLTTLGSAGSRIVEEARKFAVVVIDEAAQCSEMSTLSALQFGSSHAVLIGDPQQLPATIFSVSGRSTKFDRSLFQRLEEAGHEVHMLNLQYRMHPVISAFPRHIFYGGMLLDGPNVQHSDFGGELKDVITKKFPHFRQFNMLDIDSKEERDGISLSNRDEAELVLHLYRTLDQESEGIVAAQTRVAIITPYSQQVSLLHRMFGEVYGDSYAKRVEISTVDAFQGRESSIVIYSCVRAGDKGSGIGFLSDVQRMNVALTRAKNFLFVIARRRSIIVNPYWRDLVNYAREKNAIIHVPKNIERRFQTNTNERMELFPNLGRLAPVSN